MLHCASQSGVSREERCLLWWVEGLTLANLINKSESVSVCLSVCISRKNYIYIVALLHNNWIYNVLDILLPNN
jgi:hypothetical protein